MPGALVIRRACPAQFGLALDEGIDLVLQGLDRGLEPVEMGDQVRAYGIGQSCGLAEPDGLCGALLDQLVAAFMQPGQGVARL